MSKIKYPFSLRLLEERLALEHKFLKSFNTNFNSSGKLITDPINFPEHSRANIASCEHRIQELNNCIEFLKNTL